MNRMCRWGTLFAVVLLVSNVDAVRAADDCGCEDTSACSTCQDVPLRFHFGGGYEHQFATDIDGGGEYSVNEADVNLGLAYQPNSYTSFGIGFGYRNRNYDFDGSSGIAAIDPWEKVESFRISAPMRFAVSQDWGMFLMPSVRWTAEEDADWDDAVDGSLIAGAAWQINECLLIGPGILATTRIEDDADYYPILLIDWRMTPSLRLHTMGPAAAHGKPGLTLTYETTEKLDLFLSGTYEKMRFRLDNDGIAPGGVGEERSFPLTVGATYSFVPQAHLSVMGGVKVGGEMRIEDKDGDRIRKEDVDPIPFVGVALEFTF